MSSLVVPFLENLLPEPLSTTWSWESFGGFQCDSGSSDFIVGFLAVNQPLWVLGWMMVLLLMLLWPGGTSRLQNRKTDLRINSSICVIHQVWVCRSLGINVVTVCSEIWVCLASFSPHYSYTAPELKVQWHWTEGCLVRWHPETEISLFFLQWDIFGTFKEVLANWGA